MDYMNVEIQERWEYEKKALCHQSYTFVGQATTFSHNSFHISSSQGDLVLFFLKTQFGFSTAHEAKHRAFFFDTGFLQGHWNSLNQ